MALSFYRPAPYLAGAEPVVAAPSKGSVDFADVRPARRPLRLGTRVRSAESAMDRRSLG
jgi:hypothetical protein